MAEKIQKNFIARLLVAFGLAIVGWIFGYLILWLNIFPSGIPFDKIFLVLGLGFGLFLDKIQEYLEPIFS